MGTPQNAVPASKANKRSNEQTIKVALLSLPRTFASLSLFSGALPPLPFIMEGTTQANNDHLTAEQMLQTLKAEFALLHQQSEDQQNQLRQQNTYLHHQLHEQIGDLQSQLKHLQRDMRVLQRSDNALQTSPKTQFTRFKNLPLEIRETIWQLAVPSRLLRVKDSFLMVQFVPRALSVPTVAHTRCSVASARYGPFGQIDSLGLPKSVVAIETGPDRNLLDVVYNL